jgi:arylsulfatase A-like enzyme
MSSSQPNKTYAKLIKTSAVTLGVAAGILSVTHPQLKLESGRVAAQPQLQRPNTVVIMVDDLSRGELNVALNKGWMPNLKTHLIDKGTTFTRSFVTNSLCCPSRSTFLTGQYSHNHGVLHAQPPNGGVTKFKDNSTLATWLKQVGYRTCLVGKYLNGYGYNTTDAPSDNANYIPPGWDDWQAIVGRLHFMYNYVINDNGTLVNYGATPTMPPEEYQTDVLAQRSVNFINESEAISDAKPFFLFIAPPAPHLYVKTKTVQPAPRHQGTASQILLPKPPSFNEQDFSEKPAWLQNKPQLSPERIAVIQKGYQSKLEAMRAVDDLIGRVVAALAQNEELNNTVLIFTSDNGYLFGEHRLTGKIVPYEGSIRVPLYIRAPGFSTKQSVSQFVLNNDLAPTIAEFARATPGLPVDGRSLIPLLKNPSLVIWRQRFLVENWLPISGRGNTPTYSAVRTSSRDTATPNQLYVKYSTGAQEFYDLATDPYQLQSLHNQPGRQQQIQTLQKRLANLKVCKGQSCRILEDN